MLQNIEEIFPNFDPCQRISVYRFDFVNLPQALEYHVSSISDLAQFILTICPKLLANHHNSSNSFTPSSFRDSRNFSKEIEKFPTRNRSQTRAPVEVSKHFFFDFDSGQWSGRMGSVDQILVESYQKSNTNWLTHFNITSHERTSNFRPCEQP